MIDKLGLLRSILENSTVSVASFFSFVRESYHNIVGEVLNERKVFIDVGRNFPPQFLRDFAYVKVDPLQTRDEMIKHYLGAEKDHLWEHVISEKSLVMYKYKGQFLHDRHNLAVRLVSISLSYI